MRKRKAPAEQQIIVLSKVPVPPKKFSAEARALWKAICGELIARRTLTTAATFTVEQFVSLTVAAREASRDKKANYSQRLSLVREARLLGESLGLSPSAQGKVKPPSGAIGDTEDDRLFATIVNEGSN